MTDPTPPTTATRLLVRPTDVAQTPWLPLRFGTLHFALVDLPAYVHGVAHDATIELRRFVSEDGSGTYVKKSGYSIEPTPYVYVSVGEFSTHSEEEPVFLLREVGEKHSSGALRPGDLVVTRSGATLGRWSIFEPRDSGLTYLPSHHLSYFRVPDEDARLVLKYYLSSPFIRRYSEAYSTGKAQKEISSWAVRRIPIPDNVDFARLAAQIREIEPDIFAHRRLREPLQSIVDDELTSAGIKHGPYQPSLQQHCLVSSSTVAKSSRLRLGARYHGFREVLGSRLFDRVSDSVPVVPLSALIEPHDAERVERGPLGQPMILIDLDSIQPRTGRLLNELVVAEIGSDKVVFGDADLVVSKMRPYLGYAFLNDKNKPLIGSSELLTFKMRPDSQDLLEYVRLILLSSEYLERSAMLMSGKTHPRVYEDDLLSIRVPRPTPDLARLFTTAVQVRLEASRGHEEAADALETQVFALIDSAVEAAQEGVS